MSKQTILTLVLFVLVATFAQAKVIYVNKNAPGPTFDGLSWATAYTTVQAGVNAAVSGDEVWVAKSAPATEAYVENVEIWRDLALYGGFVGNETDRSQREWKANVTVVNGVESGKSTLSLFSQSNIDGLTLRNGFAGIRIDPHPKAAATVTNCTISGNIYFGVYVSSGTTTVSNCTISANPQAGLVVDYGTARVSNCTITGSSIAGIAVRFNGSAIVSNCIVAFNHGAGIYNSDSTGFLTLSYNDVYGNTPYNYSGVTDATGTNGSISEDPLFANHTNGDFHLTSYSPCIDAGDDAVVSPGAVDLDGQPRIQGAHVDMGAYEFAGGRPPYVLSEAVSALKASAGLLSVPAGNRPRLDINTDGRVTISDAARIARKVAGLEVNP